MVRDSCHDEWTQACTYCMCNTYTGYFVTPERTSRSALHPGQYAETFRTQVRRYIRYCVSTAALVEKNLWGQPTRPARSHSIRARVASAYQPSKPKPPA